MEGRDRLGVSDWYVHTAAFKTDIQMRRLVWAGKHQLGNAAWGASFPSERALPAGGFGSVHTPSP